MATQWPRLWHSLTSLRQTDLKYEYSSHVVCAWLGNSVAVAREHYLQVTDDHFAKASGMNEAAQNQAQSALGSDSQRRTAIRDLSEKQGSGNRCHTWTSAHAVGEGFEPPVPFGTPVFKTGALNHSATQPVWKKCCKFRFVSTGGTP